MPKRTFKKVPKTKKGVPKKYVRGAKSPSAQESEIIETRKLYAAGQLTPAMMDRISKERSQSARKKKKRKTKSKNSKR